MERERLLVADLNKLYKDRTKSLTEQSGQMLHMTEQLKMIIELTNTALQSTNDMYVLFTKTHLEIKAMEASAPIMHPKEKANLKFVIDEKQLAADIEKMGRIRYSYICPSNTVTTGDGLKWANEGVKAIFNIVANDHQGNPLEEGGEKFVAKLVQESTMRAVEVAIEDHEDGRYTGSYTLPKPRKDGDNTADVKENGDTGIVTVNGKSIVNGSDDDPPVSFLGPLKLSISLNGSHLKGSPWDVSGYPTYIFERSTNAMQLSHHNSVIKGKGVGKVIPSLGNTLEIRLDKIGQDWMSVGVIDGDGKRHRLTWEPKTSKWVARSDENTHDKAIWFHVVPGRPPIAGDLIHMEIDHEKKMFAMTIDGQTRKLRKIGSELSAYVEMAGWSWQASIVL